MKKLYTYTLLMALLVQACANSPEPLVGVTRTSLQRYSGQELYTAILFNYGPAKGLVPAVSSYVDESITVSAARAAQLTQLIDKLDKDNPKFFPGFARAIGSRDRVTIQTALQQAVELTGQAAEQSGRITKEQRMQIVTEAQERRASGAVNRALDPAVDIEVFVYAVAVLFLFVIDFTPFQDNGQDQVVFEAIADDIAQL